MDKKIEAQVNSEGKATVKMSVEQEQQSKPARAKATVEELETQLGITLNFEEHIDKGADEDTYHAVVENSKLGICKRYRLRDIGKAVPDFMAHGHKMSNRKFNELLGLKTENVHQHSQRQFHTGIGWSQFKGEQIFRYREAVGHKDKLVSDYRGDLSIEDAGTLDPYIKGIKDLVVPYPKMLIVFLAGASGIITQQLDLPDSNIMVNICGGSGSGKTTAENVALSFWGNPMELGTSFNSTINRTEQLMTERYIIPVLVDDILAGHNYDTDRKKQQLISNQIFRYSTGRIKGRYGEKEKRYYGATLVSSEVSLFQKMVGSEADGQFYRMIELNVVKGELTKDAAHAKQLEKLIRWNYGLGAFELGKYMVEHGYVEDKLIALYEEQYDSLSEDSRLVNHQRAANRLAIILTTAKLMNERFDFGIDIEHIMDVLIECVLSAFELSDMKAVAYEKLHQLVEENLDKFSTARETYNSEKHIGVCHQNVYGNYELIVETDRMAPLLRGVALDQILAGTGKVKVKQSPDKEIQNILKNWRERGWLDCCGSNQRLYKKLMMGDRKSALVYLVVFDNIEGRDNHEN